MRKGRKGVIRLRRDKPGFVYKMSAAEGGEMDRIQIFPHDDCLSVTMLKAVAGVGIHCLNSPRKWNVDVTGGARK